MKTLQDWLSNLEIVPAEVEILDQYLTSTTGLPIETMKLRLRPEADARLKERLRAQETEQTGRENERLAERLKLSQEERDRLVHERDVARVELKVYKTFIEQRDRIRR